MRLTGTGWFVCGRRRHGGSSGGVSHLLVAADVLRPGYWADSHIAVCGTEIHPGNGQAVEVEEDPGYCPVCVRAAVRWNIRRAGR